MIRGVFKLGNGEITEVIVRGTELLFFDTSSGTMTNIAGLKLTKSGVVKEFPDLENDDDWRIKVIERFKDKIKEYKNEDERMNYVRSELEKQGYQGILKQRAGWRPKRFN